MYSIKYFYTYQVIADALCRSPLKHYCKTDEDLQADCDAYVNLILNSLPATDKRLKQLQQPVSSWMMEAPGTKRVKIIGKDDKRQLTAVLGCSMSGDFLQPQLIYQGKTKKCLPHFQFPDSWDVTYSENHWTNENTTRQYIINILLPYLQGKKKELKLSPTHRALVLFNFKGQCTEEIFKLLDSNDINVVMIPPKCTDITILGC